MTPALDGIYSPRMKTTDRPRGRPLKAPGTRREVPISILLRQDEKDVLMAAAEAADMPFSAWARKILLPIASGAQTAPEVAP